MVLCIVCTEGDWPGVGALDLGGQGTGWGYAMV